MQVVGSCSDEVRNKHKVFVSNKEADIVGRVRPDAVPPGTPRGVVGENCPMAVRTAGDPEQVIARVEAGSRNFSKRKISVTESHNKEAKNVRCPAGSSKFFQLYVLEYKWYILWSYDEY